MTTAKDLEERRAQLTEGGGFFRFDQLPATWRAVSTKVCCFCKRGEKDGLDGLWEFGPAWICSDAAKKIESGVYPEVCA